MAGRLMVHCGGEMTDFKGLGDYELPKKTATYCPIPHQDLVRLTGDRIEKEFPGVEMEWEHATNKEGKQYFGVATLQIDCEEMGMAIALRNSYDKSMSAGFAAGVEVFVCDNLALSGSAVTLMRKHTGNAWEDLKKMIYSAMIDVQGQYDTTRMQLLGMKEVDVEDRRGAELIGWAQYERVLTDTQANVARKEWRSPTYDEFEDRNLYSLYNAFTEAGKRGRPGRFIDRYSGIHDFFAPNGECIEVNA